MSILKNIARKALVAAIVYAGKRVAVKVAGKVADAAKKSKPGSRNNPAAIQPSSAWISAFA